MVACGSVVPNGAIAPVGLSNLRVRISEHLELSHRKELIQYSKDLTLFKLFF